MTTADPFAGIPNADDSLNGEFSPAGPYDILDRTRRAAYCVRAVILISGLSWLTTAWYLMLAVGIIHHDWLHRLPTLSYGTSLLLAIFVNWIFDGGSLRARFDGKATSMERD